MNFNDIVGKYEGRHLMLYKELTLRYDSTYLYSIEGDMYPTPIKQEGYWKIKNGNVQLNATQEYKAVKTYSDDSVISGIIHFYFYDTQGNPVNDFTGSINAFSKTYRLDNIKDNLYKVAFDDIPKSIIIVNSNNLYKDFELKLGSIKMNIYHINLFIFDELQKNKWKFKYQDGKLYQKKGFKYIKVTS